MDAYVWIGKAPHGKPGVEAEEHIAEYILKVSQDKSFCTVTVSCISDGESCISRGSNREEICRFYDIEQCSEEFQLEVHRKFIGTVMGMGHRPEN